MPAQTRRCLIIGILCFTEAKRTAKLINISAQVLLTANVASQRPLQFGSPTDRRRSVHRYAGSAAPCSIGIYDEPSRTSPATRQICPVGALTDRHRFRVRDARPFDLGLQPLLCEHWLLQARTDHRRGSCGGLAGDDPEVNEE